MLPVPSTGANHEASCTAPNGRRSATWTGCSSAARPRHRRVSQSCVLCFRQSLFRRLSRTALTVVVDIRLHVALDTCIRLTKPTIAVLETLLSATSDRPAWGLSICREADLGPGTVYPILERLAERGWVTSYQETAAHPGRPPRRFYELTGTGRQQATDALQERRARRFGLGLAGGAS